MRDAMILFPVCLALLAGIWKIDDLMIGASKDLVSRWVPLYFIAWGIAWILVSLLFSIRWFRERDFSHFTRCIAVTIILWPLLAISTSIAEEWTIAHRVATWSGPSDMGYGYLYWEMSGMGYARGWFDLPDRLVSFPIMGLVSSVVWFTILLLSLFVFSRILPHSKATA